VTRKQKKARHSGSTLDSLLKEDGILEDVEAVAIKHVVAWRGDDDITEEEWKIIEQRSARRDLATDEEVEQLFSRYRSS
jgi:hypothetical protein